DRAAEERVAREPAQELAVVGVTREAKAEPPEAVLAVGAQVHAPVRALGRGRALDPALPLQRRHEQPVAEPPCRVGRASRRQAERVGPARRHDRVDHRPTLNWGCDGRRGYALPVWATPG